MDDTTYKIGTCRWCGDKSCEIYRDNLLCDFCDSETIHCYVCRRRQGSDNHCRHVFQDEYCQWRGAGVAPFDEEMRLPFHRLLSAMGEDFARDLREAIKSKRFYTWLIAPMIGGGGILELHGFPFYERGRVYGDRLIELGESGRDDLTDGYRWLASLYERNTTKANRTTLAWIDRWLWPLTP